MDPPETTTGPDAPAATATLGGGGGRLARRRPTTPDTLLMTTVQWRANPFDRVRFGPVVCAPSRSAPAPSAPLSASGSGALVAARKAKAGRPGAGLLGKHDALTDANRKKSAAIVQLMPKLLQCSADLFGELSIAPECGEELQGVLQDVVRIVSEDCLAIRNAIDRMQDGLDVQAQFLAQMAAAGAISVQAAHVGQLEDVAAAQDRLIDALRSWIQLLKAATDARAGAGALPGEPRERWAWLQTRVRCGMIAASPATSIRKRLKEIFFRRVTTSRCRRTLKQVANRVNFLPADAAADLAAGDGVAT